RRLRQRCVDYAVLSELLLEALRDLERASVDADVLADQEHPRVAPHLLAQAVRYRLQIRLCRQPRPLRWLIPSTVVGCVQLVGLSVDAGDGLSGIRLGTLVGALHGLVQQPL